VQDIFCKRPYKKPDHQVAGKTYDPVSIDRLPAKKYYDRHIDNQRYKKWNLR